MKIKDLKLFLVRNTTSAYPVFYISAENISEATNIAQKIVSKTNDKAYIINITFINTPLLELDGVENGS